MYLSFRRAQDALLALGFFVLMVVVVFSTLLYVQSFSSCLCQLIYCILRYFIERGTWDDTLGTFINSDGDPSQFAVSLRCSPPPPLYILCLTFMYVPVYSCRSVVSSHLSPTFESNDTLCFRFVIVSACYHLPQWTVI